MTTYIKYRFFEPSFSHLEPFHLSFPFTCGPFPFWQEEEKRKREELERIVEENNKKIEEAQRKLVITSVPYHTFRLLFYLFSYLILPIISIFTQTISLLYRYIFINHYNS